MRKVPFTKFCAVSTRNSATTCRLLTARTFRFRVRNMLSPMMMSVTSRLLTMVAVMGIPPKIGMVK